MCRVSLKSIKYSESLSEETYAFTATLYLDGQKIGYVKNDGRGGCNDVDLIDRGAYGELNKYAESLPPVKSEFSSEDLPMDLDFLISTLVEEYLVKKDEQKEKKRMDNFVQKEYKKFKSHGYSTVKVKTEKSVVCIPMAPTKSGETVVEEYKAKNPTVKVVE